MTASPIDPSGELRALASDCVHCGFCLPVCPTYQLWGEEMDSPRGRIHLMTQILDGAVAGETVASEAAASHLDRCLGCMACVPACPSGVQYDRLIEAARGWAEEPAAGAAPAPLPPRSMRDRAARAAIFATFPYPARLRMLTRPLRAAQRTGAIRRIENSQLAARFAPELIASLRVAPSPPRGRRTTLARRVPAQGPRRAVVGLLTGCVQRVFFPGVNEATVRVLAAEGCDVVIPRRQGCCGALSLHSGRAAEAAGFARQTIATFEDAGVETVVVNSAGCGSAMKEYTHLFPAGASGGPDPGTADPGTADPGTADPGTADWARRAARFTRSVRDLSEFLAELAADGGPRAERHPLPVTAVYHEACHLGHAQGIRRQPRELLGAIPGLELVEPADPGTCCGSAGVYNLLQPEAAGELGARKAASVLATGAPLVISANPGCSLQISAAMAAAGTGTLPAMAHIAEVLDASLRGLPVTELTGHPDLPR
jgi:glycolate oxidase iron-sulfur subunit